MRRRASVLGIRWWTKDSRGMLRQACYHFRIVLMYFDSSNHDGKICYRWNSSNPWSGYSPVAVAWTVNVDEVLNYVRQLLIHGTCSLKDARNWRWRSDSLCWRSQRSLSLIMKLTPQVFFGREGSGRYCFHMCTCQILYGLSETFYVSFNENNSGFYPQFIHVLFVLSYPPFCFSFDWSHVLVVSSINISKM